VTVLAVEGLSVAYGAVQALSNASFEASDGAITAVLGANGAGKTTLLRTMTGLVKAKSGSVRYGDIELTGKSVEAIARAGVAHVPEGRGVIAELTVEENLRLGALWSVGRQDRQSALEEIYELFPPLTKRRRGAASTLSGGERQMLAIGRALISRPKVLLLDEPSLGLAPMVTAQLMAVLRDLTKGSSLLVVLVEQNARSALSVAQRAVVLNLGKVVVSDSADRVLADQDLRRHYLGF
jgi:branched-chain amino acid transport system ATP-binding protein